MRSKNDDVIRDLIASGQFIANNDGTVYSFRSLQGHPIEKPRVVNQTTKERGYKCIKWRDKHLAVHRIVFQFYLGELDSSLVINHKDGNPSNNHVSNLEQVTQGRNNEHRYRELGHKPVVSNARINQSTADEIRRQHESGKSYRQLVREFGISKSTVSYIINHKTWKSN
ncbi:MAG: HNH endonuclease [Deltaproteobacteria bacterium]|nr:HNH endonuclease [Deltaproteobacteria bacterium]